MRTFLKLVFVLAVALALPMGAARAGEPKSSTAARQRQAQGQQAARVTEIDESQYTTRTVNSVSNGTNPNGYVFRGDIFADLAGHLCLLSAAPARGAAFLDGSNRSAILVKTKPGENGGIQVFLPRIVNKTLDRWALHKLPDDAQTIQAAEIFVGEKSIGDTLPATWQLAPCGNISDLRPEGKDNKPKLAGKSAWYSYGDVVPDGGSILIGNDLPIYPEAFIDRWDVAPKVSWNKEKLQLDLTMVNEPLDPIFRQPDEFVRDTFTRVSEFIDRGVNRALVNSVTSPTWPSRLRGTSLLDEKGNITMYGGDDVWISARQVFVTEATSSHKPRLSPTRDVVGSSQPFLTSWGNSYQLTRGEDAVNARFYYAMTQIPSPCWVFALTQEAPWGQMSVTYYNK